MAEGDKDREGFLPRLLQRIIRRDKEPPYPQLIKDAIFNLAPKIIQLLEQGDRLPGDDLDKIIPSFKLREEAEFLEIFKEGRLELEGKETKIYSLASYVLGTASLKSLFKNHPGENVEKVLQKGSNYCVGTEDSMFSLAIETDDQKNPTRLLLITRGGEAPQITVEIRINDEGVDLLNIRRPSITDASNQQQTKAVYCWLQALATDPLHPPRDAFGPSYSWRFYDVVTERERMVWGDPSSIKNIYRYCLNPTGLKYLPANAVEIIGRPLAADEMEIVEKQIQERK